MAEIFLIVALTAAVVWISALVSVLTHAGEFRYGTQLIWVLVILIAGPIGALLYFLIGPHRAERPEAEPVPERRDRAGAIADPWSDR